MDEFTSLVQGSSGLSQPDVKGSGTSLRALSHQIQGLEGRGGREWGVGEFLSSSLSGVRMSLFQCPPFLQMEHGPGGEPLFGHPLL